MTIETKVVRAGVAQDPTFGAVIPPIYLSSTFSFEEYGVKRLYDYTRSGNPTRDLFAGALAELEGGAGALITSTGMSSVLLVLQLLKPSDLIVAPHDCYGGTFRLLNALADKGSFLVEYHDVTTPAGLAASVARKPRILWIETPSNPILRITDVREVVRRCQATGTLVVVDNTLLSPALQQPLALGADLVVHSTTKYLNGHSDVVGGAVVARDQALFEELAWWCNCLGIGGSPFDAWLQVRGVRTLFPRIRQHVENTEQVVEAGFASGRRFASWGSQTSSRATSETSVSTRSTSSLIASMTTSARPTRSPFGSAISRALAASRSGLVRNLRARVFAWASMPFLICSGLRSCSETSMPEATHHPAMSAPIVPAPIT